MNLLFLKSKEAIQREWKKKTLAFATAINRYVETGLNEGWEKAGAEPIENGLEKFATRAIDAVREANRTGTTDSLRELWPPAHAPLIQLLEKNGQDIPVVCLLEDGSIAARIGAPYESGHVVIIRDKVVSILPDISFFGYSPNKDYFAYAKPNGISITNGWLGKETCFCRWPHGDEEPPEGFILSAFLDTPTPTRLIPFPDGQRVLLVSSSGIYVTSEKKVNRLLPTQAQLEKHGRWLRDNSPHESLKTTIDMAHGAISHDGKLIAIGCQDSTHLVFDSQNLNAISDIGNMSEYPHYALFSADDGLIAFNSCHFYSGITIGVRTGEISGLKTEPYEDDSRVIRLDDAARVYAGVSRKGEFIIGDANGYIRSFDENGKHLWQLFIGSTIGDIDISADGSVLVASTFAGFLSIVDLDVGKSPEYQIGFGGHAERRRWLFWKNEPQPLIW